MKKTWKPQVAGVLSIVSGVVGLIGCLGILIAIASFGSIEHFTGEWYTYWQPINVVSILWTIEIPVLICSTLALIGGIFAVQRKFWGMALAGSIAAFLPLWPVGLASVILTSLSRDEFGAEVKTVTVAE
jgi:hypothetical protein